MRRLSPSEFRLLIAFTAAVLGVAAYLAIDRGLSIKADLENKLRTALTERQLSEQLLAEGPMWQQRGQWLQERLPRFASSSIAAPRMQVDAKAAAERHRISLKSQNFIPKSELPQNPAADTVGLTMELTGQLQNLVAFLHEMQQPGRFIDIRQLTLRPEGDSGAIHCELDLIQYFREG